MAVVKSARVVATQQLDADTRVLDLIAAEPLGFVGGQYIIIDSGRVSSAGKAIKRAYSMISGDADQRTFQLAVKRIPDGLGSEFLHELGCNVEICFSGPWGKMVAQPIRKGTTLILATDTGVSAALGMLRSTGVQSILDRVALVWLRTTSSYFLTDAYVHERIPSGCADVRFADLAPIGAADRITQARAALHAVMQRTTVVQAFFAGDGAVNYALLDDVVAAGIAATRDSVESFFNMPKQSS